MRKKELEKKKKDLWIFRSEDSFHRRWRPDWDEIENPADNDRRKINESSN